jgi:uncharacterized surface protein with fasciclin (FAS1) repeats
MKRHVIAGFAAGTAMMIGGALGAVTHSGSVDSRLAIGTAVMNPMVGGQAMLADHDLLENVSASPDHSSLAAAMKRSGVSAALGAKGEFTIFAPTDAAMAALPAQLRSRDKAQLARLMSYLLVPGNYDSQELLKKINEGAGEARLRTLEGGILLARMNGPTNIILVDEKGKSANISIYDIHSRNGVMHVVDRMLEPGVSAREIATN